MPTESRHAAKAHRFGEKAIRSHSDSSKDNGNESYTDKVTYSKGHKGSDWV